MQGAWGGLGGVCFAPLLSAEPRGWRQSGAAGEGSPLGPPCELGGISAPICWGFFLPPVPKEAEGSPRGGEGLGALQGVQPGGGLPLYWGNVGADREICTHIHICTLSHTCTHRLMHPHMTDSYTHTYTQRLIHTHRCICTHTHTLAHTDSCTHTLLGGLVQFTSRLEHPQGQPHSFPLSAFTLPLSFMQQD